ncbi:MAG: class I SAM-dependent methyltransferase [Candidatus Hermodarchaeota archaeon]
MKYKEKISFNINLCKQCGFIFLNPRFSEEDYKKIYKYEEKILSLDSSVVENYTKRIEYNYNFIKKFYRNNLKDKPNILDYGGNAGYMLLPFLKEYNCYLIDYFEYELHEGIHYLGRTSADLKDDIKFNIIFSVQVLEHVNNPRNLIEVLGQKLSEDGILYVQVPLGCLKEWKSLDTPLRHINFFSGQSLYNCFRYAGLKIIYLKSFFHYGGKVPSRWMLNIIGTKKNRDQKQPNIKYLSTKQQYVLRYFYFIPYFLLNKKYKLKTIKEDLKKILIKIRRISA